MDTTKENDLSLIRIIRSQIGKPWSEAEAYILEHMPNGLDSDIIDKFVDKRENPGIHLNAWGVEPRFYLHRESRRLLEFYPSK